MDNNDKCPKCGSGISSKHDEVCFFKCGSGVYLQDHGTAKEGFWVMDNNDKCPKCGSGISSKHDEVCFFKCGSGVYLQDHGTAKAGNFTQSTECLHRQINQLGKMIIRELRKDIRRVIDWVRKI